MAWDVVSETWIKVFLGKLIKFPTIKEISIERIFPRQGRWRWRGRDTVLLKFRFKLSKSFANIGNKTLFSYLSSMGAIDCLIYSGNTPDFEHITD